MGRPRITSRGEVVPVPIHRVLDRLAAVGVFAEFYLAGGTGLALLIQHRRSVDLDCFSRSNRLDDEGRRALLVQLREVSGWQVLEVKDGTIHGAVGKVKVSFFWYPQPLVKPLVRQGAVRIASMEDIGLMKLGAIIGRGSRKDFVDLYAICRRVPLRRVLALGQKKFRDSRDFRLQALKALSFFDDAERDPVVVTPAPLAWGPVKRFFLHEVLTLTDEMRHPRRDV